jgi:ribosomal-protein-alanine N-acetyltransferase
LTLRILTERDLPALVIIEKATQFSPWSEDTFSQCILFGAEGWVVEMNQQIIGFVLFFSKVGECHILNIGVHPDYQHQGYGKLLMNKVIEVAHKELLNSIYLEVRCSNKNAIALYEKMGFKTIGTRKDYYKTANDSREDAFVFVKIC